MARGQAFVDVGFWGGAVPAHLGDLAALHEAGVFGFKCFLLDSGVAEFPHLSADELTVAMTETARLGSLLLVHAEDGHLIHETPTAARRTATSSPRALRRRRTRPIGLVIDTARRTGGRAHVVHLSSAGALPDLRSARADGRRRLGRDLPALPHAVRGGRARPGHGVQVLPADPRPVQPGPAVGGPRRRRHRLRRHRPLAEHRRSQGAGLRARLGRHLVAAGRPRRRLDRGPVPWRHAHRRRPLDVDRTGRSGRADRARAGSRSARDADLAVLAPDESFVVDVSRLHHKNQVSAYAGRTLQGVVRRTFLAGREVGDEPRGRLLARGAP